MINLVSIILPTYNRGHLISNAIESVLKQEYKNWELIVVDDGSTDNTFNVVSNYLEDDRVFYHKIINSGPSNARNVGMKMAKGNYVTFLDSDDEYYPFKIQKQLEVFKNSTIKNLGVVSCGRKDFKDGKLYFKWKPRFRGDILDKLISKRNRIGAGTPFLMIKRQVLEENIFFDIDMPASEDSDFLIRVLMNFNFDFVNDYLVKVNHHQGDRVHINESALIAIEKQYYKYFDLIIKNNKIHNSYLCYWADYLFISGNKQRAFEVLDLKSKFSINIFFWKIYLNLFNSIDTLLSRIFLKILRKI